MLCMKYICSDEDDKQWGEQCHENKEENNQMKTYHPPTTGVNHLASKTTSNVVTPVN